MLKDKLLLWKLKRGSRSALQQIYEKYKNYLLWIATGLLFETSEAEDVVHDVFASFVDSCGCTGNLKGYLAACVANKARNHNRTKSRSKMVGLESVKESISNLKRPDEWIIQDEEVRLVNEAIGKLPYEQREVIVLRIHGSLKFKDIARLQETSIKTALSRYRYGIDKLRSKLKERPV